MDHGSLSLWEGKSVQFLFQYFSLRQSQESESSAKGGTEVLPGVPLACLKLTIGMEKSPGQPGDWFMPGAASGGPLSSGEP